jgi:exonuclease III
MQGELSTDDETAQPTCGNCSEGNSGVGCWRCYIGDSREYDHPEDGLSQEIRDLKPDLVFRRRENQREVIEIIEFSCPYGYMTQGENALKRVFEQKQRMYRQLAQELSNLRQERERVIAVIGLSLGPVYT